MKKTCTFSQSAKDYLSIGNKAQWCLFVFLVFCLLIKTTIFHICTFHSILLSSLWNNPLEFFKFWGGKMVPILFISSFIFVSKKNWWTIIANILVDLWIIANMFYYKANALLLGYETIKMIDNLNGFWDSLYTFIGWDIFSIVLCTIIYVLVLFTVFPKEFNARQPVTFVVIFCFSFILDACDNVLYYYPEVKKSQSVESEVKYRMLDFCYPFCQINEEIIFNYDLVAYQYTKDQSIISLFPACFVYAALQPSGKTLQLTESQIDDISICFNREQKPLCKPGTNIIFILVESLESWPLDSICEYEYMPHLSGLIRFDNVIFVKQVKCQTKYGNSMDGQMINVTGLLPISNGATTLLFEYNTYPGIAECFSSSSIINPSPGIYRQQSVAKGFQFKNLFEDNWNDNTIMEHVCNYTDSVSDNFFTLGITIASHVPFSYGKTHTKHLCADMPSTMSNYLNCLAYTDSCIGVLFDHIKEKKMLKNTTVVITGDHTIFKNQESNLDDYAKSHNIDMQTGHTFTPLIIYSPLIENNVQITDTCYQMDIYPTIMNLIGCEDYYWKGVGVNLLDSTARKNRQISEEEAYRLSDMLIRSNAFELYKQGKLFNTQQNATAQ